MQSRVSQVCGFIRGRSEGSQIEIKGDWVLVGDSPRESSKIKGPAANASIACIRFEPMGGFMGHEQGNGLGPKGVLFGCQQCSQQ
jgi:hypothetical protein